MPAAAVETVAAVVEPAASVPKRSQQPTGCTSPSCEPPSPSH